MSAIDLFQALQDKHIEISIKNGNIVCRGSPGALNAALKNELTMQKLEFIAFINEMERRKVDAFGLLLEEVFYSRRNKYEG